MFIQNTDVNTIVEQIKQLPRSEEEIVLLLIGEHSTVNIQDLLNALKVEHIPIAGGIFPGVIYDNQKYETGIVATSLPILSAPHVITGLDATSFSVNTLSAVSDEQQYTALVLVDGLTKYVALFLDRLFRRFGNAISYIGGGAGSLSFQQKPCIFDSEGMYQDAALILWIKATTSLGVRHGWQDLLGPRVATRTEGTLVYELDGKPAFQVYSQLIKARTGLMLTHENFFSIAKEYPLGLYHPGVDRIVRDPISFTEDGALVCVGEVPVRSMVYILRGDKTSLIDHARRATLEAVEDSPASQHNFVVDCISRVLYLEDDFSKELDALKEALPDGAAQPFGVLSLGEIATFGTGRVEFFNKTFVVGSLQAIS